MGATSPRRSHRAANGPRRASAQKAHHPVADPGAAVRKRVKELHRQAVGLGNDRARRPRRAGWTDSIAGGISSSRTDRSSGRPSWPSSSIMAIRSLSGACESRAIDTAASSAGRATDPGTDANQRDIGRASRRLPQPVERTRPGQGEPRQAVGLPDPGRVQPRWRFGHRVARCGCEQLCTKIELAADPSDASTRATRSSRAVEHQQPFGRPRACTEAPRRGRGRHATAARKPTRAGSGCAYQSRLQSRRSRRPRIGSASLDFHRWQLEASWLRTDGSVSPAATATSSARSCEFMRWSSPSRRIVQRRTAGDRMVEQIQGNAVVEPAADVQGPTDHAGPSSHRDRL